MSLAKPTPSEAPRIVARGAVAFVLTALVHGLFLGLVVLLGVLFPKPPPKPPARPVSLRSIDARSWASARGRFVAPTQETPAPLHPKGQVVDVAEGNHRLAPDAKYLAESNNRVEKETRAREQTSKYSVAAAKNAPDPMAMPMARGAMGGGKPEPVSAASRVESFIGSGRLRPSLLEPWLTPEMKADTDGHGGAGDTPGDSASSGEAQKGSDASNALGGGGAPNDDLKNVAAGDATALNTREWRYASFFNRVKQAVAAKWDPNGKLKAKRLDPGVVDRSTLLAVTLRPDGTLADVFVEKGCGVEALDVEAVAAFERAAPFPNPPKALVEHGVIAFRFSFTLSNLGAMPGWMPRMQRW